MENLIYEWSFSDNKNRGKFWYIIAISIVIGLAIWGILTKQYGLTFIVFLISGVVLFIENNSSENIEIKINNLGIKISDNFYDFKKIKNFGFIYNGDDAIILRLNLNAKGISKIDLKINNQVCSNLKSFLPNFLEEIENTELTGGEKIINFLKL